MKPVLVFLPLWPGATVWIKGRKIPFLAVCPHGDGWRLAHLKLGIGYWVPTENIRGVDLNNPETRVAFDQRLAEKHGLGTRVECGVTFKPDLEVPTRDGEYAWALGTSTATVRIILPTSDPLQARVLAWQGKPRVATLTTLATALRQGASGDALPFFRQDDGWRYSLSTTPLPSGESLVMFSAQLVPEGRGSSEADWTWLGAVAGALKMSAEGVERLKEDAGTGNPNRVLKTWWTEGGSS